MAGLGLALTLSLAAPGVAEPGSEPSTNGNVPVIEHNSRSFRIPFNYDPEQKSEIKEIALIVSEDQGRTWKPVDRTAPDARAIAYRAPRDGEYWFAVQTIGKDGRLYPPNSAAIEPKMKVIVDTIPPKILLEAIDRHGSLASVRWDIRDDRLDRNSFILEYQTEGERDWRQIPVRLPAPLIGEKKWDAGTAEPLRVRAIVSDRAKNAKEVVISLPDGSPENPKLDRGTTAEVSEPPPLESFGSNQVNGLPEFPNEPATKPALNRARRQVSRSEPSEPPVQPPPESGSEYNPFDAAPRSKGSTAANAANPASNEGMNPRLIASPKFNLQYEVEDAGPNGPAVVELWITLDGGRTWSRHAEDPDRKSPFPVDLGGEGTYGLTLVAKSASNLGDPPPGPGDRPQYLVEVDSTPPMVKLEPVRVGTGKDAGKIVIIWHASDLHLAKTPIVISVRPEGTTTWRPITTEIENSGRFVWTVPANAPARFYVRIDVVDSVGNRHSDETPEGSPVMIDRTRPKSRIIGLDASTRNASGPMIHEIR